VGSSFQVFDPIFLCISGLPSGQSSHHPSCVHSIVTRFCKEKNCYVRKYLIFTILVLHHLSSVHIFYKALSFKTPLIFVLQSKLQTPNFRSRHKKLTTVLWKFQYWSTEKNSWNFFCYGLRLLPVYKHGIEKKEIRV
jgi:hypothetical protein